MWSLIAALWHTEAYWRGVIFFWCVHHLLNFLVHIRQMRPKNVWQRLETCVHPAFWHAPLGSHLAFVYSSKPCFSLSHYHKWVHIFCKAIMELHFSLFATATGHYYRSPWLCFLINPASSQADFFTGPWKLEDPTFDPKASCQVRPPLPGGWSVITSTYLRGTW